MEDIRYWIGFNHVGGIGPVRLKLLLDQFGNIRDAWNASAIDLARSGINSSCIESLLAARNNLDLDKLLEQLERQSIHVICWDDPGYPVILREIEAPPPVLYMKGEFSQQDEISIAVVGTRRPSPYGRAVTVEIVETLACAGITIISGLARGIDAIAHQTALSAGGRTAAVLGSGIDHIYPPEHGTLAIKIARHGAVITDYPLGTRPEGKNFPPRNRIISGLSRIVIVVEAGEDSGALITSSFAADQGRDVYAVPGSIFSPGSHGPHKLIENGASILKRPEDVLEALQMELVREEKRVRSILPENDVERRVLECMSPDPMHVDDVRIKVNLPVQETTAALTMLELKGRVRRVGAMQYVRLRERTVDYKVDDDE